MSATEATSSREHRPVEIAQARQPKVEIKLLREFEKTFSRNLASVKKKMDVVKVENASLRWFRGSIDDNVAALGTVTGSALKAVAESAQL